MIGVAIPLHRWTDEATSLTCQLEADKILAIDEVWCSPAPGSHAANVNRCFDWAEGAGVTTLVILDHDVEILDPAMFEKLDRHLTEEPRAGVVGTVSLWHPPYDWRRAQAKFLQPRTKQPWLPGYCHAYRLDRLPEGFRWDDSCPTPKGMTDTDACFQLREAGLEVWCATNTAIRHIGPSAEDAARDYTLEGHNDMMRWLEEKWGDRVGELAGAPNFDLKTFHVDLHADGLAQQFTVRKNRRD